MAPFCEEIPMILRKSDEASIVATAMTRGQGVVDWKAKNGNVTLILELDLDMYSKLMYTAIQRR